jgi:hypothetical protein
MANENDLEWFTPGKSCKKCDTKPFSGFDLLHFYESVFPLIRESLSEAIKRKLSNRDYKMEKMRCHVGNLTCRHVTWMCGSNDVYILEFFQYVSQHSHLKYWN